MLNAVVVGTGYIGLSHIAAYKNVPGVKLAAVVDMDETVGEKAAKDAGCQYFATLEEAASKLKIDIVDICLPTFLHEQFVVNAAFIGAHVMCEKPVTFTLQSFDRMTKACTDNGVRFMVAQVERWNPDLITAAEYVRSGKLGDIHMIYEKRLAQHPNWSRWHRDPAKSGGGLYDLNIHDIDFLFSLFGMPESVYALGWKSHMGCWNHVVSNLIWADGKRAVCEASIEMTGDYPFSMEFRGVGDGGTIQYCGTAGFNIKDGEMKNELIWYPAEKAPEKIEVMEKDPLCMEISEFVRAVTNKTPVPIPPEESRQVLQIVLGMKESLETGQAVKFKK